MPGQRKNTGKHSYLYFVTAWVSFLLIVLLIIGGVSYWILAQSRKDFEQLLRTRAVLVELSHFLYDLRDAEVTQRQYLVTEQESYLQSLWDAEKIAKQHCTRLQKMTAKSPSQQTRLDIIERLVADKFTELRKTFALRSSKHAEAPINVLLTDKEKRLADDIRRVVLQMEQEEEQLLKRFSQNAVASVRLTVVTTSVGIALIFAAIVLAILKINRSIAAREQASVALRQAKEDADAANEAKSEFLANMSHEIRTPMNAIMGFSEVLAAEDLTGDQKHHVSIIRESAENLLHLMNDILDFSKIEAGKLDVEIIDCHLGRLLTIVESLMRPAAIKKGLKFEVLQCGELPAKIRTSTIRLQQCLTNLINNAIKFTEEGHVYVNVSLQRFDDKPYIRFDVEDTGIGITPEKQKLVFETFVQADSSTTRRFGGTGLGLAITRRLAHLLGGELSLTSELGKGSVLSLTIPANVDVESQPLLDKYDFVNELNRQYAIPQLPSFTGNVLVVEDSRTNQMLTELLLQRLGLEVTIAEDGQEAVSEALSQSFDIIFMDIQMPNMSGYDATRILRRKGLTMPIVALTAHAMKGDDEKCYAAGCSDYLPKPLDPKELLKMVGKYLTPQNETLEQEIDSVVSHIDQLGQLYSDRTDQISSQAQSADLQTGENVIDWVALTDICDDEDIIRNIARAVLDDAPRSIESIANAVKAENPEDVQLFSHRLKGSAMTIGATRLSQEAYRLECAGRERDMAAAASILDDLQPEFDKLVAFLSKADWIETTKQQSCSKEQLKQS